MTQQERQLIRDEGTAGLLLVAVVFQLALATNAVRELGLLAPEPSPPLRHSPFLSFSA